MTLGIIAGDQCFDRIETLRSKHQDEIKTHMREREEALRSKTPTSVAQEIWGLLIAYNLVRCRMLEVAHDAGVPQTQVSFRNTIHLVRIFCLVEAWDDAASKLPNDCLDCVSCSAFCSYPQGVPRGAILGTSKSR